MQDNRKLLWLVGIFLIAYFLPLGEPKVASAILEAFRLLQWYAIHHTLACVVPAMFIAGAISTFLSHGSVMRHLGAKANPVTAYAVASVAGIVLAVCSCSVLPMFAGIYTLGAGLGPASAFLYSGPAINVMAIFLSARVLGFDLGLARAVGSVTFAVIIGLLMAWFFRDSEQKRLAAAEVPEPPAGSRSLLQNGAFFLCLVLFLIFSDWYNTNDVSITLRDGRTFQANVRYDTRDTLDIQEFSSAGRLSPEVRRISKTQIQTVTPLPSFTQTVHGMKWGLAGVAGLLVLLMVWRWFTREEVQQWMEATREFGLTIVPLLFGGVFVTGFVGGLIPESAVAGLVGGNSFASNFTASFVGMIWYFATLTEVPVVEMLLKLGMGKGPALALLLAGPALSLPSILVLSRVMGARRTAAFCALTVVMSTVVGMIFGLVS